jgi:hypothetical protein
MFCPQALLHNAFARYNTVLNTLGFHHLAKLAQRYPRVTLRKFRSRF